jgi:hypothetical protein
MRNTRNLYVLVVGIVVLAFIYWGILATALIANPPGEGESVTVNSPTNVQHQYRTYDYEEAMSDQTKTYRIAIPAGLTTVRGILVITNYAGGDSREYYRDAWYGEFLHLHNFAFVGAMGNNSHIESFQVFQRALAQIAKESGHPELVNVPYATTGLSAGGGFASRLVTSCPEKVLASVIVCSRLKLTDVTPTPAMLGTPVMIINGETENSGQVVYPNLEAYRPVGALYGFLELEGRGHEFAGQEVLAMPYLEEAIRLRYPSNGDVRKGPLTLKPVAPMSGWVADNRTWKSGITYISPAKEFKGDIRNSSWLLNKNIAFIYRAYATYNKPLTITSPSPDASKTESWATGSNVPIVVDATKFPNWKTLEFYDGSRILGEITQGSPQFTAKNLTPGYHVFSVLGTDTFGTVRTSNPVLVIVRKP